MENISDKWYRVEFLDYKSRLPDLERLKDAKINILDKEYL